MRIGTTEGRGFVPEMQPGRRLEAQGGRARCGAGKPVRSRVLIAMSKLKMEVNVGAKMALSLFNRVTHADDTRPEGPLPHSSDRDA